jgi:hypothetical protein
MRHALIMVSTLLVTAPLDAGGTDTPGPQSAIPAQVTVGCEPDTSDLALSAPLTPGTQSQEVFNNLAKLKSDDWLVIRKFDGMRCVARHIAFGRAVIQVRINGKSAMIPLTDVRLIHKDKSLWREVTDTSVDGATSGAKGGLSGCAGFGPNAQATCGGLIGAAGAVLGAGAGLIHGIFENPKRMYERQALPPP